MMFDSFVRKYLGDTASDYLDSPMARIAKGIHGPAASPEYRSWVRSEYNRFLRAPSRFTLGTYKPRFRRPKEHHLSWLKRLQAKG